MLKQYWRLLVKVLILIGVLLSFFALLEILRAYQTLHRFHPVVGYVFLGILACAIAWLVVRYARDILLRPRVLTPPRIEDRDKASIQELKEYAKYLGKYLRRLEYNECLSDSEQNNAKEARLSMEATLQRAKSKSILDEGVRTAEKETVEPLLATLDEKAETQIQRSVRDVMLGVTLSPYKAADLFIVVYRNVLMVTRIVGIYHSRPRFREQIRIVWDILRVVALVNFLNLGKKIIESLFSAIPGLGRFADDVAQGIGASMLTSTAGHAAKHRCRSFSGWSEQEARNFLVENLKNFFGDCRGIAKEEFSKLSPVWDKISEGLSAAGENIAESADSYIKKPVVRVLRPIGPLARSGKKVVKGVSSGVSGIRKAGGASGRTLRRGANRLVWWRKSKDSEEAKN